MRTRTIDSSHHVIMCVNLFIILLFLKQITLLCVLNQAFLFCYIFCVEFTFFVCWTPLPVLLASDCWWQGQAVASVEARIGVAGVGSECCARGSCVDEELACGAFVWGGANAREGVVVLGKANAPVQTRVWDAELVRWRCGYCCWLDCLLAVGAEKGALAYAVISSVLSVWNAVACSE